MGVEITHIGLPGGSESRPLRTYAICLAKIALWFFTKNDLPVAGSITWRKRLSGGRG